MKKIVMLVNSLSGGGAEKVVIDLAEGLNNLGVDVELVCLERSSSYSSYKINPNISVAYLLPSYATLFTILKLPLLFLLAYRLRVYIYSNNIHLVQSHLYRANFVNILSKVLFKANHTVQVVNHGVMSEYSNRGLKGLVNLKLISLLYPYSNNIISVSNAVERDMQKIFNFNCNMCVIHNPINTKSIKKLSTEVTNDFIFDNGKRYVISVGRLIDLKRNADLLYALLSLDKNVEVIYLGEGDNREDLVQLSFKLKLAHRVHFLGWRLNPYSIISKCEILVLTSSSESFGNVLVEAMACGVPVISTKCGGPEEIISNGVNGILINVGSVDDLVKGIKHLFECKDLTNKYIKNGKRKSDLFETSIVLKKYRSILNV